MVANASTLPPAVSNRRRRVRHKIQTPAYVSFTAESKGLMLDLHEIVDISEDGVAIQCHAPLEVEKRVNLCLDLADCSEHIYTTGQVIWANDSGRAGLRFAELKQLCGLTDGNLSRHLQVLQTAKLVEVSKDFERNRVKTVCRISAKGRKRYLDYVAVLEQVILDAAVAVKADAEEQVPAPVRA